MYIKRIEIQNFLGIAEADIAFGETTLLYGPNGSGKSSVLDAIVHAVTGDTLRHELVAGMIREGAKSASIDAHLTTGSVRREVTRKGRAVFVDGVEAKAADVRLGSPAALRSALRSGAILDLRPAELQALIASVTGAAEAKPVLDPAPFTRIGLQPPARLAEFDATTKRAVEIRREAKATLADRQQSLAAQPVVHGALAARCEATTEAAVRQRVAELQRQRDAAAGQSGARAERRRDIVARLAEIPEQAVPDLQGLRDAQHEAQREVVRTEEATRAVVREILSLERTAQQTPTTTTSAAAARDTRIEASRQLAAAESKSKAKIDEGRGLGKIVDRLRSGGTGACPHCTQPIPVALLQDLDARLETLRAEYAELSEAVEQAKAIVAAAEADEVAALQAQAIRDTKTKLDEIRTTKPVKESAHADAVAKYQAARKAVESATAIEALQAERVRLQVELTKLDAPAPTGDLAQIDADLAEARELEAAMPAVKARKLYAAQIAEAEARAKDADAVADALQTARAETLARLSEPFTREAGAALAILLPETTIEVREVSDGRSGDGIALVVRQRGELRPIEALSDGERTRVLYALQYAVVRLAKVPLLLLDRAELVDDAGRDAVKRFAAAAVNAGIQVVMATSRAAPATSVVDAYSVSAGRVARIPQRAAA